MTCDFVDPDFYHPKPHAKREIDILMVAGWGRVKRHWLLFQALRRMRRGLRVVLIGKDLDGRTANDVFREAKAFSVADRIEILRDVPFEAVADYQCNARISLILSQQEGSCVAVTESLFADTPMGMMEGAHVGPVAYINPHTGKLLRAETTHLTLSEMIERSSEFGAREWALNHISCSLSSAKLNRALRKHAEASGAAWTTDIRTFCWRRTPEYLNPDDSRQMAAAHAELYRHHGVRVLGYSTAGTLSQEPV
jgi:hypothetical protein